MDQKSLDDIYKMHIHDIYVYLLSLCHDKHTAEDILQDTFFKAYLYVEDCKEGFIKPWLFKVARNAFIDYTRKNKKSFLKEDEYFMNITDGKTSEDKVLKNEYMLKIEKAVNTLSDKQKEALKLCVFQDLSYRQAADVMGISLSYFKVLLFRGRQALKKQMERENIDE